MTQLLTEPHAFLLPADWTVAPHAVRTAGNSSHGTASARRRGLPSVLLAACLGLAPLHIAYAQRDAAAFSTATAPDLHMAEDAAPMRAAAEHFTARAMAGDSRDTLAMLSPALVARIGRDAAGQAMQEQIVPFFQRGRSIGRSTTITRTTDAAGHRGYAFYQWLEMRDGSPARPFTVYVVKEGERVVVANVVPDQLVAARHR